MNYKVELTKYVAQKLNLNCEGKNLPKLMQTWWKNPRSKPHNGYWLTEKGFECFVQADIQYYKVRFEKPPIETNKFIVWADNLITCPFYYNNKAIFVFDEKIAVQIALFCGDMHQFIEFKAKIKEKLDSKTD